MVRSRKWEGEVIQIMDVGKECIRSGSHCSKGLVSIPCQVSADKAESYESSECSSLSLSLSVLGSWQIMEPPKKMSTDWLRDL